MSPTKIYSYIKNDEFLKNNVIYFFGSFAVSVLNYLYYPVIGRFVSISDFGEIQTLISIILQMGILFTAFGTAITNIVANSKEENEKIELILFLQKVVFIGSILMFFVIVLLSIHLQSFFKFVSIYPFIALGVALTVNVAFVVRNSYMQGKKDFKSISIAGVIYAGCKIVFSMFLVIIGTRTFGAITGVAIAQLIAFLYLYSKTKDHIKSNKSIIKNEERYKEDFRKQVRSEFKYLALIFILFISVTLLYSSDVLIVKHFFNPQIAGLYSSISTAARIIFFITGSVGAVLIPSIKMKNKPIQNIKILFKSMAIIFVIGGGTFAVFSLAPSLVIRIIMGSKFLPFAYLLPRISLMVFLVSIINLFFSYFVTLRDYLSSFIAIIGLVSISILIYFHHSTIISIINSFILVDILMLFLIAIYILYNMGIMKLVCRRINSYR
jgi:O-antigen/teichoic acid export membrane protein